MAFAEGYVDVAARIVEFREKFPEGRLRPLDPRKPYTIETLGEHQFIVYAAVAMRTPDDKMPGVGMAWEHYPGKTPFTFDSELQNAETSAWGRAIVAALIADTHDGIASAQEVENRKGEPVRRRALGEDTSGPLTTKQRTTIYKLMEDKVIPEPLAKIVVDELTKRTASALIDALMKLPAVDKPERVATVKTDV